MFLFRINRVLYLGFLKFLKRDKGKEPDFNLENMEDLDVPPAPPNLGEKELGKIEDFPGLPELPKGPISDIEEEPLPKLEPIEKPAQKSEFPSMEGPKLEGGIGEPELPPVPEFPSIKEPEPKEIMGAPKPLPPRPLFGVQRPKPLFDAGNPQEEKPEVKLPPPRPKITPYERFERSAVREERAVLKPKEAEGSIYIRVDKFRGILAGTRTIRNNLKIANQSIQKMNDIDANSDRVFEKWRNSMVDLQKKLIFIDKTLFKKGAGKT